MKPFLPVDTPCSRHPHSHRLIQPALVELTDKLRQRSRKITAPRQAILNVLRRHQHPLTNKEIHAAVNSPLIAQRFQELGVSQNLSTPEGMRKLMVEEIAKWNALIDKTKIQRL